jgi:hypothetical protein
VVLVCVALALVHLIWGLPGAPAAFGARFLQLSVAGSVVALVASPWLIYNYVKFGNVIPISGQSEGMDTSFATNLPLTPTNLFEYVALPIPIPAAIESLPPAVIVTTAFDLALAYLLVRRLRSQPALSALSATAIRFGLIMAAALLAFYGLFFGAGHFMSRYLFALSPLCAVLWVQLVYAGLERLCARGWAKVVPVSWAAIAVVQGMLLVRLYQKGDKHQHFQVVTWVQKHVPDTVWIGAIQTGTLGYFHDRTINLDGKVNPYALAARKTDSVPQYVAQSQIQYLADWTGITDWMRHGPISGAFDVIVDERDENLAVLKRRAPTPAPGGVITPDLAAGDTSPKPGAVTPELR